MSRRLNAQHENRRNYLFIFIGQEKKQSTASAHTHTHTLEYICDCVPKKFHLYTKLEKWRTKLKRAHNKIRHNMRKKKLIYTNEDENANKYTYNNLRYRLTEANFQSRQLELMTYTPPLISFAQNARVQHRFEVIRLNFRIFVDFVADTMVRRALMTTVRADVCLAHILASIDSKLLWYCLNSIPSECWYVSIQSARTDC